MKKKNGRSFFYFIFHSCVLYAPNDLLCGVFSFVVIAGTVQIFEFFFFFPNRVSLQFTRKTQMFLCFLFIIQFVAKKFSNSKRNPADAYRIFIAVCQSWYYRTMIIQVPCCTLPAHKVFFLLNIHHQHLRVSICIWYYKDMRIRTHF